MCTYKMRIIICSEITDLSQFQSLPRLVKTITVKDNTCNTASTSPLVLNGFSVLTHITIGRNSLKNIRWFTISSLPSLEVILIGSCSFSTICDGVPYVLITNSKLSIFDCPTLTTVFIGDYSFSQYSNFNLDNLPSLETMEIGKYSFYYITNFIIRGRNADIEVL